MPEYDFLGGVLDEVEDDPVYECDHCGSEHSSEVGAEECCPSYDCNYCGREHRGSDAADEAYDCCRSYCGSCGSAYSGYDHEEEAANCCRYACPGCGDMFDYEDEAASCCGRSYSGPLPYLPIIDIYDVSVPEIPARPVRVCSVEQELVDGAAMVAQLLYDIGASGSREILGYHSRSSVRGEAHVEEDGSLPDGGGEVVYDRFDLSNPRDAALLSTCLTKIRQLRDLPSKPVKTGFSAGIHVHVSAMAENGEMLTPRDLSALYELWCYAEDMLYSLSAAGWNRHRQPTDNYGGYCKAVPKFDGTASPAKVWRAMRADRYYGLNFQKLYNAVARCSCGASTVGDWESCDCGAMDNATIEWRVFNASTLPRTLHAWIVMAHAITAYSKLHELGTLPTNEYGSQSPAEKREVLNHLLDILPLSDGERELIEDAADRSPGL